jgi:hypothetical protein
MILASAFAEKPTVTLPAHRLDSSEADVRCRRSTTRTDAGIPPTPEGSWADRRQRTPAVKSGVTNGVMRVNLVERVPAPSRP